MISTADTEKFVSDIDNLVIEMTEAYQGLGKDPPPPEQLREQARCAWTYMTIDGMLQQFAKQARAAAQKRTLGQRSSIILPNGRPVG